MKEIFVLNKTFRLAENRGGTIIKVFSDDCSQEELMFINENLPENSISYNIKEILSDLITNFNKK